MNIINDIEKVYYSEEELHAIVERLGKQISEDYKDKNLLMVSILKGSVIFKIDFMCTSAYGAKTSNTGAVKIVKDLDINLEGYDVLIVEDILDSGKTLSYVKGLLEGRNPRSIKICTLLDKPERRVVDLMADYSGTEVPDEFVVGYGLDYDEKYRNLPYIGVLKEEIYNN